MQIKFDPETFSCVELFELLLEHCDMEWGSRALVGSSAGRVFPHRDLLRSSRARLKGSLGLLHPEHSAYLRPIQ